MGDYQGFGKLLYSNGDMYTGYFVENKRKGFGTCTWANGESYSGQWDEDTMQGNGTYTWLDGTTYTGQFINKHASGFGTLECGSYQKSYACITDDQYEDDEDKYEDDEDNLPDGKYGWLHYNCEPHWEWICKDCYLRDHSQCRIRMMWTPQTHLVLECGCKKPAA
ncbi:Hypothetical protein MVR_LOCUS364 [uncultured virus]|nr:Hypothetical protein MVR_LOCUS364 [uncultured virus]